MINLSRIQDIAKRLPLSDKEFPKRVIRTTIILSIFLIICSTSFLALDIILGLTIGVAINIGFIYLLCWMTSNVIPSIINSESNNKDKMVKRTFMIISFLKYGFLIIALFFVFRCVPINLIAFFIGISVAQIVIIFKLLSITVLNYLNRRLI